jgi:benzoyl-CoA reductase/2-hydroxyglutaryl-CoA dehydratase subunit BcrC/BadD/HgdB
LDNSNNDDLKDKIISLLAQYPFTYSLFQNFGNFYFRKSNQSFLFWLQFFTQQLENAYQRKKPVVWANIFTPSELLYALDVIPIYPEMISASVASIGLANYFIEKAESNFYLPDLCSFYRVASGMYLRNCLPKPDMVISTSLLCDGSVRFFQNVSRYYHCDYFLIDPPYEENEKALIYLTKELESLKKWVTERAGRQFSLDTFQNSLALANESRLLIQRINHLRESSPAPLSGWDALAYQMYMYFSSLGSEAGVEFYEILSQEVEKHVAQGEGVINQEKARVLWLHQLRPYYPNIIWQTLLDYNTVIAFEEISQVWWSEYNLAEPFLSLAKKILTNPGAGPVNRRISSILNLIEKYHIDGVIHFNQRGCRQSCGGASLIKEFLKMKKIPMLILDGDGIDARNYSEGQTRTRLEAFLEIINQKN